MKKKRLDWREIKDRLYDLWMDVSYWAMMIFFWGCLVIVTACATILIVYAVYLLFTGKLGN